LKSTLIAQSHVAKLKSGTPAVVLLLRPEHHTLQVEPGIPSFFDERIAHTIYEGIADENVVTDFFDALRHRTNFTLQIEALQQMARDEELSEWLAVPRIMPELSTSKVLLFEMVDARSTDQFLQLYPYHTNTFALRLCQTWLHQAFFGHCYPADLRKDSITVRKDSRLSFGDCDLTTLPRRAKTNLWSYLTAVASDNPDKAAMHLLSEMSHLSDKQVDPERFRSSFRQAASFGALEPVLGTNSNALAHLVFQHWKTALENGYRPQPHLLSFYRGFFALARVAARLSPARDSLREGLEQLRIARTLKQVRDLGDWSYWFDNVDKFANAFARLPKAVDEALTHVSEAPQDNMVLSRLQPSEPKRPAYSGNVVVAFILAVTALLAQFPGVGRWPAKLAAIALMLAGLFLLRQVKT